MRIAFLPWGACEQHGPLLPPETDTLIADHITRKISDKIPKSTVLPHIPYGVSAEHDGLAGTISLDYRTAIDQLENILISAAKNNPQYDMIVVINGHGGNQAVADLVCNNLNYAGGHTKYAVFHVFPQATRHLADELFGRFSAHADSVETSVIAAILGSKEQKVYHLSDFGETVSRAHIMKLYPVRESSACGIVSKTETVESDPEKGREIIKSSVHEIMKVLGEYEKTIILTEKEKNA